MEKDRQIQLLRDGNLELREQITELNKDILDYKELLELKNLSSQVNWQKTNERNFIKNQTNNLNEEIRKLREALTKVVETEKKKFILDKYESSMGEYEKSGESSAKQSLQNQQQQRKHDKFDDAVDQVKQILALSQDMAQANFDSKRYEELKDDMAALQSRLKEFADRNNQLCSMLTDYESKYKDFETQIGKLSHDNNDLLHQIENLTQNLTQFKRENAKLSENNIKVTTELEMFQKNCKCRQISSSRPITPPNRHLSLQIKDLRKQLIEKTEEYEKLKDASKRKQNDLQRALKQALSDKERYHKECDELVEVVGDYKSRVAILDMNLQRKDSELVNALEIKKLAVLKRTEMEKSSKETEKRNSDLLVYQESLKQQMEELRNELANIREEHRLEEGRTLEELQAARQAIRDQQLRITQQETNFKLILDTKRQLEQKAESYLKEIQKLKTKLSDEINTKTALMELSDVLESEQKSLKDKLCRLMNADQDLGKAVNALENLKQHNYDLTIMHSQLQRDYNLLRENHQQLIDLRTQSVKSLEISQNVTEEGDAKEAALRCKIDELLGIISILMKDRDYLKSIVNEKHRDITILSTELNSFNLASQSSIVEYPTKMHQPFFPTQMLEIPSRYTAESPTTVAVQPEQESKLTELRQLRSTMQHITEAWTRGVESALEERS
uniref:CSON005413 protein n=1 Tax=Culicoides sonorensis TaxID=179676 RepID=A0A336K9T9_CULSO